MKKYLLSAIILAAATTAASAHGVAGDRVFPSTLAIDDPAVADELTLPQIRYFDESDDGASSSNTQASFEYSKRITKDFGISLEGAYTHQSTGDHDGFDNFGVGLKYQILTSAEHEAIISLGVDADIGGTGSHLTGAESYTTFTPTAYFGKGFGDLPDSVDYLKPFAITGLVGYGFPSDRRGNDGVERANNLEYGFTVQYSIPYLQQHVKDLGILAPFNGFIPAVEFQFETPTAHNGDETTTTGTINPGIIWEGESTQFGLEAVLPLNSDSGHGIGFIAQAHFYLDDLFPSTIGKPIW